MLAACSTVEPPRRAEGPPPTSAATQAGAAPRVAAVTPQSSGAWQWADSQPLPGPIARGKSVWTPARWSELPGWGYDALHEAWNAWLRSCERPAPDFAGVCAEVRQLTLGSAQEQHEWLMRRLQPYRLSTPAGEGKGLLTGYYEPMMSASRTPSAAFPVPLYRLPPALRNGSTWYSRQEMATLAQAQTALRGQEIAWLADPIDALMLQIQGSGRLMITEPDGSQRQVRLAYAGTNGHPYQSVGRWLLDRKLISSGSWEAIRAWAQQNPARVNEMLWSNPRVVFFREEPLSEFDARFGPRGAQGVALTPGRSIAVDRDSIPYGTPLWLRSAGPAVQFEKLVLAQDTGSAIVGAVRADYFTGWGDQAYTLAAGLKQPLELWALWPRSQQ
jgi:membrane-bound lytic murein transglycosylase A